MQLFLFGISNWEKNFPQQQDEENYWVSNTYNKMSVMT